MQYQRPPVVEPVEALVLDTGERLDGQIKYYDYGVLSVVFELPFAGEWEDLIRLSGRWVWDTDFAALASRIVKKRLERARPALIKPLRKLAARGLFHLPRARHSWEALRQRT